MKRLDIHPRQPHLTRIAEHDRKRFGHLARRGVIPSGSVEAFVGLAAAARRVRAATGSDAMPLEGVVEVCNRPAVERWIRERYR